MASCIEDVSLGIAVMAVSVVINFYVSQKLMKTAKRTESIALEADAWHLRTDVLTSLGIFAGLVAIKLTGITILDPIFAILVALFILKAAIELTIKSVKDLMDVKLPEEEVAEIERIIRTTPVSSPASMSCGPVVPDRTGSSTCTWSSPGT